MLTILLFLLCAAAAAAAAINASRTLNTTQFVRLSLWIHMQARGSDDIAACKAINYAHSNSKLNYQFTFQWHPLKSTIGRSNMSQSLHVQSAHLLLTKAQDSTPVHEEAAAQHETNTDEGTCHWQASDDSGPVHGIVWNPTMTWWKEKTLSL